MFYLPVFPMVLFGNKNVFSIVMSKRMPDVNGITTTGKPVLIAACENGTAMEKICLMLIERGADVNATDSVKNEHVFHYSVPIQTFQKNRQKQLYMPPVLPVQ